MTYRNAKQLHNEDEVIRKDDNAALYVISARADEKNVFILCDDGNEYHHTEVL